jgi:hypothetical protein
MHSPLNKRPDIFHPPSMIANPGTFSASLWAVTRVLRWLAQNSSLLSLTWAKRSRCHLVSFGRVRTLPVVSTPFRYGAAYPCRIALPARCTDHDLTGAIAEIKKASTLLRRPEPAIEVGRPSLPIGTKGRSYWSVWVLIGTIWISATLVVASAAGAILYELG